MTLYGERSEMILVHGEIDNPAIAGTGEGHDDAMQKNIPLNKPKWPTLLRTVNFRPGPNDFKRTGATAAPANAIVAPANTIQQQASVERSNLSAVVEKQGEIRGEISDTCNTVDLFEMDFGKKESSR